MINLGNSVNRSPKFYAKLRDSITKQASLLNNSMVDGWLEDDRVLINTEIRHAGTTPHLLSDDIIEKRFMRVAPDHVQYDISKHDVEGNQLEKKSVAYFSQGDGTQSVSHVVDGNHSYLLIPFERAE